MKVYTLIPQDLLFFRDGRPTETSGGHGARWPEPSTIFDAIHAALWRAFPERQPWEHLHDYGRSSHRPRAGDTQRFGALTTAGLFPVTEDGRWLFPAPADATADTHPDCWLLQPFRPGLTPQRPDRPYPKSNLPQPLKYPVGNFSRPGKSTTPTWWSITAWEAYIRGTHPAPNELFTNGDLFLGEWFTGIAIDPDTQTTGKRETKEKIYSVEYLRLKPGVRCGFIASLPMKQNGDPTRVRECITELFVATQTIIVGGQQRPCRVEPWATDGIPLPRGLSSESDFNRLPHGKYAVKWALLTPAIWPALENNDGKAHPGGWLPNWICPQTGKVLLKYRAGQRHRTWEPDKKRTVRKAETESEIDAYLVAAVVPKPIPIIGWTERLHLLRDEKHWTEGNAAPHGPRPTHLATPAGAVYYFEAENAQDAAKLAAALNWHGPLVNPADPSDPVNYATIRNRRSTLLGEKGFGLGVCGTWSLWEDVAKRP